MVTATQFLLRGKNASHFSLVEETLCKSSILDGISIFEIDSRVFPSYIFGYNMASRFPLVKGRDNSYAAKSNELN